MAISACNAQATVIKRKNSFGSFKACTRSIGVTIPYKANQIIREICVDSLEPKYCIKQTKNTKPTTASALRQILDILNFKKKLNIKRNTSESRAVVNPGNVIKFTSNKKEKINASFIGKENTLNFTLRFKRPQQI
jgi:hypothetical protein